MAWSAIMGWRYVSDEKPALNTPVLLYFAHKNLMTITEGVWTGKEWIDYTGKRKIKDVSRWLYVKDINN